MSASAPVPPASAGDPDQHHRSLKKPKHSEAVNEEVVPEEMEVQDLVDTSLENPTAGDTTWTSKLFPESSRFHSERPHFYMGEDEEEWYAGVDELFSCSDSFEECPPKFGPRVEISKEKYTSLFKQWRGALIIKLLGKLVSYQTLHQRVRDLWNLDSGLELTNLEEEYYIVCFFTRADYLHVLEGGSWIILGHYLTVMKWRPQFRRYLRRFSRHWNGFVSQVSYRSFWMRKLSLRCVIDWVEW